MARFRLLIEYTGTRYSGWQVQKNARTVAGGIERAAREAAGVSDLELYGAGRTDAGVHALGQVAHLELRSNLPAESLRRRINDGLPADINILRADPAPHRFHARHDAVSRTYVYQIALRRTAFAKPFVWWVREPLALDRMRRTAAVFEGFNDFGSFTHDDPSEKSTAVAVSRVQVEEHDALVLVRVEGIPFPVADGPAHGRCRRRGRARHVRRRGRPPGPAGAVVGPGRTDGAAVRPVSRARHVSRRPSAGRPSPAARAALNGWPLSSDERHHTG